MTNDIAIKVENLSKKFARTTRRAMMYGLVDIARAALIPDRFRSAHLDARISDAQGEAVRGKREEHDVVRSASSPINESSNDRINRNSEGLRPSEFWALRDVSFEVKRGECLGVIGPNGAGKSTLFSILSGIYGPTRGRAEIRGRVQALIALGAGFHPMLTGRENVYINAAVLGLKTREINLLFDEIIDFAELAEFVDMPVGRYSSGMMVRLGFSVAVHMSPDILLVDEVLAVGDIAFRNKSFKKMLSLIGTGIPVLFVSHHPPAIEMICSRVLWLDHGRVRMTGETDRVLGGYVNEMDLISGGGRERDERRSDEIFPIRIDHVDTLNKRAEPTPSFAWNEAIVIRMHYRCTTCVESPYFVVKIRRAGGQHSDFTRLAMCDDALKWDFKPGEGFIGCRITDPKLAHGAYEIRCAILRSPTLTLGQTDYQEFFLAARFSVKASPSEMGRPGMPRSIASEVPPVLLDHTWDR